MASTTSLLEQAVLLTKDLLKTFAQRDDFSSAIEVSFGDRFNLEKAEALRQAWAAGDFTAQVPAIQIESGSVLQGANGAYAAATNQIYLSQNYLDANTSNPDAIVRVLLEEIGHFLDSRINTFDAQGDEGAIFSSLVQGVELTSQDLEAIRAEDDTAFIQVDGQRIQIEQAIDINALIAKITNILQTNLGKDTFDIKFDENASLTSRFGFTLRPGSNIPSDVRGFLPSISGFVQPTGGGFALQDITLDTQSLLGSKSFLGKIKETLETIIKPIQPIVDILLKPVPLLSDLSESIGGGLRAISSYDGKPGNEISVLDVIGFAAKTQNIDFDPSLIVKGVETFKFLDSLKPQDGIKLGTINFDANGSSVKSSLPNINLLGNALSSHEGVSIPLLQNPSDTVLNMLLGKPVDLFKYKLPELKLQGTITQIVPVIGPLGVSIGGTFDINTNLGFGLDTSGFKSNKVEQGIYFTDRNAKGEDVPEFNFGIGPVVGAGLQLAVASIDMFAGMNLNLGIDLSDPNKDGKLSLNEFGGLNSFNYKFSLGSPTIGGSVKILGANVFSPKTPSFIGIDLGTISGDKINLEVTRLTKGIEEIENSFKDGIDDIQKALDIKFRDPVQLANQVGDAIGDGAQAVKDAAAKGARNLDPTNPNSPVGRALPELDPTNPNGVAGKAVKATESALAKLDPFNRNSPVGKAVAQAKTAVAAELKKLENAAADLDITNRNSKAGKIWAKIGLPPIQVPTKIFGLVASDSYSLASSDSYSLASDSYSVAGELQQLLANLDRNRLQMAEINTYLEGVASGRIKVTRQSGETDAQAQSRVFTDRQWRFEDIRNDSIRINDYLKTTNWSELIQQELLANGMTLEGDNTDDVFVSSYGEDTLKGNGGNDNLNSGGGFDKLSGGSGNDYLNAGDGADYLTGDSGNDRLYGGTGNDRLYGYSDDYYFAVVNDPKEPDNDSLYGGSGNDILDGGKGDDLLRGGDGSSLDPKNPDKTDKDMLIGESGNDTLYGGEDDDRLFGGADNDFLYGEAGNDLLIGDEGNDILDGGTGADNLYGINGDDILHGSADNDHLDGGAGKDYLYGDGGNDVLKGGSEGDLLDGGDDDDELWGGEDVDTVYGGSGTDRLYGGQATDYLYGGLDDDVLYGGIAGNDAFDTSVDYLYSEEGNDRLYGQAGDDELDGGEGNDSLYGGDNNDLIKGGSQDDALYGGAGEDLLYGDRGIDSLYGGEDNDRLYGGENNDLLYGEGGDDVLYADGEADYLNGGYSDRNIHYPSGNDTYVIDSVSSGGTVIEDYNGFASDNDRVLLPVELSEDLPTGLDTPAVKNLIRQGQDLIIDLNQDGTFSTSLDLTIKNFFLRDRNTREPLYLIEKINKHITGDALLKYFNIAPKINVANNFNLDGVDLIPNANNGNLIAEIVPDGGFDDPDVAVDAIAITSIDNNRIGIWQYSLDNGQNWRDFAAVSDSNALLLKPSDRVRFNPNIEKIKSLQVPGNNSWRESQFSFRAWDLSDEARSGTYANITKTGGNSAFSTETATAKVSLLLEPPINTWNTEIKNYPATFTDPTIPSVTRTPDDVGIILHDAALGDRNIFLVGNTTGILGKGQNFLGGFNDTWVASVDVATGEVKGKVVLATAVSDARAKVAWAKNNSDTAYMSFRSFPIGTINNDIAGWLNKYNFATGEHKFVNVANSAAGLVYPVDIDTDSNGNVYALFNLENRIAGDGKADNQVVVYDSSLKVINSVVFGDGVIANKIAASSLNTFSVAGIRPTNKDFGIIDLGGYEAQKNSFNNTQAIFIANFTQSNSGQYVFANTPADINYYDFINGNSANIKSDDVVTDLVTSGGVNYVTTNYAAIAYSPQQQVWSSKIFKAEQSVTGLSVDENSNVYILGKTAVTNIGSTAWVTKYGESPNNAPASNFDVTPAIWHKASAQGTAINGFNYFPNELLFDPGNKLGMALVGRATKSTEINNVFADNGDYVWGTGLQSINHAPNLVNLKDFVFLNNNQSNTIYLDSKPIPTYSVADLISSNSSNSMPLMGDLDRDTLGIVITSLDNTNGVWHFSNDNGNLWWSSTAFYNNVSDDNAVFLGPNTLLHFVPNQGYIGSSSFNFRLWDLTDYGSREDLNALYQKSLIDRVEKNRDPLGYSVGGGDTPYSAITGTARIDITNHSPVFTTDYLPQIPYISYKNTNSIGIQVDSLVPNGAVKDGTYSFLNSSTGQTDYLTVDRAVRAIAVTSVDNSNGKWQFFSSTGDWIDFGNVTENAARLLSPDYKVRFVPNKGYIGNSSFTFRAWDRTNGNAGETFDATANGGTTPFSSETRTATIATTNTAPYVASYSQEPLVLRTISHNNFNDSSETIADLLPNIFYDTDETTKSIAVTQVDNSNGIWQYSPDNGEGWIDIGTVSQTKALLLDSSHKIRFVPNLNFVGRSSFSFKAWDGSSGIAGLTADVTKNGGQTPFSSSTETVYFDITNAAPRFLQSQSPVGQFSAISNTNISPLGNTIAEILPDNAIVDDDGNPQKAIAIVSADSSNGKWQYSLDYGDTWQDVASISTSTALLLAPDSKVRFIPNPKFVGAASLSFRAWDKTVGTAGQLIDTSRNGDNKAFSNEIQKAEIAVTNIDREGETIATALDTGLNALSKGVVKLVGSIGNNPSKSPEDDIDFYKVQLNQDDILSIKLATTEINSPLDASIWVYDSQGLKLAFSDSSTYFDEPFISFSAPYTDTYYISVSASGNEPYSPFLEESSKEITSTFGDYTLVLNSETIDGGTEKSFLRFTKIAQEGVGKNEAFAFVVDDLQGRIGGIMPGQAGYLNAALDRSQVVFSNLGNNSIDIGFDRDSQRYLNFTPGARIEYGLIADDTLDRVKTDLAAGQSTSKVLFSLPEANTGNATQAKFTVLPNDGGYQIAWEDNLDEGKGNSNTDFNDLVLKVEMIDNFTPGIGTGLQGKSEGEVFDLRGFAGQALKIDTLSVSDAAYNNYIGFYAVEDTLGTLANGLKVDDVGYAEAAIKSAVLRSFKNETQSDRSLTGGKIFAPVLIANGTFDDFLKINPQNQDNSNIHAYFNYLGANTDKVDHFRLLGDNKFGVEDLYGGGDRDYNDLVFQVNIKS